jgi:hypothetical protein
MTTNSNDRLRPRLQELESELQKNLEDVCEKQSVERVDTGELIRIEETLSIAANAAKEAVSLRRKMHQDRDAADHSAEERPQQLGDAS